MTQGELVTQVVCEADGPLSADEIRDRLRGAGHAIGAATVYRAIRKGLEDGRFQEVRLDGVTRVEPADRGHHHHFVCDGCERVFDFHGCPGGLNRLAPAGFSVTSHEIVLHGLCLNCKEAA